MSLSFVTAWIRGVADNFDAECIPGPGVIDAGSRAILLVTAGDGAFVLVQGDTSREVAIGLLNAALAQIKAGYQPEGETKDIDLSMCVGSEEAPPAGGAHLVDIVSRTR